MTQMVQLSQLGTLRNGMNYDKSFATNGCKIIGVADFSNRVFPDYSSLQEIDDTIVTDADLLQDGDILFVRSNGNKNLVGRSMLINNISEKVCYSGFCIALRPNNSVVIPKYLFYALRSPFCRKQYSYSQQTNITNLSQNVLGNVIVPIPDYEVQEKHSNILYNIDSKIMLNTKICSELETMAKTLYDYWFVQFDFPDENGRPYRTSGGAMEWNDQLKREIPKGWKVMRICDIADLYQPKTISGSDMVENGLYNVYGANGIIGKYNSYNHENRTIAITCRGASCGNFLMTLPKSWITGNAMVVSPHAEISQEYLYYTLSKDGISPFITGSAQPQITRENLSNLLVVIADEKNMTAFSTFSDAVRRKIESSVSENEELTKLRDWLLPMLMNGQARVE